jgi:presenilin enhancer 2
MSGIGAVIWIAVLTTWITVFQLHRAEWGATADQISFIIPTGIP